MRIQVSILVSLFISFLGAANAQQSHVRLVARSVAEYNGSVFGYSYDSTSFKYAGTHKQMDIDWQVEQKYMKYDTLENYLWHTGTGSYVLNTSNTQQFDANDNITQTSGIKNDNGSIRDELNIRYKYNASNKIETEVVQIYDAGAQALINKDSFDNQYNAQGELEEQTQYVWDAGSSQWQPYGKAVIGYDANGNNDYYVYRLYDAGSFKDQEVILNTFNAGNELITSVKKRAPAIGMNPENYQRHSYTYQSGAIREHIMELWDDRNGVWLNDTKVQYTYNGSNDLIEKTTQSWNTISGTWENSEQEQYSYYVPQQIQYKVKLTWNGVGFVNSERTHYEYNASDLLAIETQASWNNSFGYWEHVKGLSQQKRYFYEYNWPASVHGIDLDEELFLYPVPANTNLYVQYEVAGPILLAVYDINGRLVRQWTVKEATNNIQSINIADLSSGVYTLKVQYGKNVKIKQFSIVR